MKNATSPSSRRVLYKPYMLKASAMFYWMKKHKIRQCRSWEITTTQIWSDLVVQTQEHALCLLLLVVKDKEYKCLLGYIHPSAFYLMSPSCSLSQWAVSCTVFSQQQSAFCLCPTQPRMHRSATWFKVCIIAEQQSDYLKMHFCCVKCLLC